MIRLLLLAILFFLAYTFVLAVFRLLTGRGPALPREKTQHGEDMVRDSECGIYIPVGQALEKTVRGEKHYFCSSECREAFRSRNKE